MAWALREQVLLRGSKKQIQEVNTRNKYKKIAWALREHVLLRGSKNTIETQKTTTKRLGLNPKP